MIPAERKYFILRPRSKFPGDPYAKASRAAMIAYAESLQTEEDAELDKLFITDLLDWVAQERAYNQLLDTGGKGLPQVS